MIHVLYQYGKMSWSFFVRIQWFEVWGICSLRRYWSSDIPNASPNVYLA